MARGFEADGSPATDEVTIAEGADAVRVGRPWIAMNGSGQFIVVWHARDVDGVAEESGILARTGQLQPQ